MGNEIVNVDLTSPEYNEAITLHQQIITNGAVAATALYEMCRLLKRMRDGKFYVALGYCDFETYCEEKANIKKRQAYNYISCIEKLGDSFMQSNASIGITKLELLTHLNPIDRVEFMDGIGSEDLKELSVPEMRALIDRLQHENGQKGEQLEFFTSEKEKKDSELADLYARLEKTEKEKAELEATLNAPKDVAIAEPSPEQVEALVKKRTEKLSFEVETLKNEVSEARSAASKSKENYESKLEKLKKKLDKEKNASDEKVKQLEQQLQSASKADEDLIEFKFYFASTQENLKKFLAVLDRIEDAEKKEKYKGAAVNFLNAILEEMS